ncbi:putative DNA binding domain-containing protein [bacterium]|nr:putative DNA binding domain-containing protein [bacterium]
MEQQQSSEVFFSAESENTEFKVQLPKDSAKYIKSVIAFANTQGGRLIIGVDDKTRRIVGIDGDVLFKTMDDIANAVSDSCVPQIVPRIEPKTVDGKNIIAVTVSPGPNRPYYLKSKGKESGTFIRTAGTSRPASADKIKELEMEGRRVSWDEQLCMGFEVTENAVRKLCGDVLKYRDKAGLTKLALSEAQLVSWKLLRRNGSSFLASNAFALLVSDVFPFSKTQCAVFKGADRAVFLDKREFSGPVYEQIEQAVNFVMRNIRLGAVVEGAIRKEAYELPEAAVREAVVNAHCHRSFTEESCVQIAVYENRLEVTSPGGLYNGLTLKEALSGHSRLRNKVLANLLNQMGLVEAWGSGIGRIIRASDAYGLPEPEFVEYDSMFRVNIFRSSPYETLDGSRRKKSAAVRRSENPRLPVNETRGRILKIIGDDNNISAAKIAEVLSLSVRSVEKHLRELREAGLLLRHGPARGGYWEIVSLD